MKINILSLVALITIALVSCQKQLSDPNGPNDPGPTEERKLLLAITYRVTGLALVDSFVYDGQDRCVKYVQNFYDSSQGPNPAPYEYFYEFHYQGNDTLPYKITDTSQGRELVWLVQYDAQGRKTVDSARYLPTNEKFAVYYSYTASRVVAKTSYSRNDTVFHISRDTFDLSGNNCIARARVDSDATGQYWSRDLYTHDNHPDPYTLMNIGKAVFFGSYATLGNVQGLNKNNILTETSTNSSSTGTLVSLIQYTYDADGYPVQAVFTAVGRPDLGGSISYKYNK